MLILLWRSRRRLAIWIPLVAITSFALNIAFQGYREAVFYLPVTRAWELMIGAWLAWAGPSLVSGFGRRARSWLAAAGVALIVAAVLTFDGTLRYPGFYALVATVGASLLVMFGNVGPVSRLVEAKPSVWLGKISYPLYLWHWPLLSFLALRFPMRESWADRALGCLIAVGLAALTYRFVEQPIRNRFRDAKPWLIAPLGAGLAATACLGVAISLFTVATVPKEVTSLSAFAFDEEKEFRIGRCHLGADQGPEAFAPECSAPVNASGAAVLLWGDSTATALSIGLRASAGSQFAVTERTASLCPPLINIVVVERPNCAAVNQFVLGEVQKAKPDIVIMSALQVFPVERFQETIAALREAGAGRVVVVGPPPLWPRALPSYILARYAETQQLPRRLPIPARSRHLQASWNETLRAAVQASNAIFVSSFDRFCLSDSCLALVDGTPTAFDGFHLTPVGSALMADAIVEAVEAAR